MPRLTIGVDAGGTATVAALAEDGVVVQTSHGPGANASTVGADEAARRIAETILRMLGAQTPEVIFAGAAGAGRPSVATAMEQALRERFPSSLIRVTDDACIALRAAVAEGDAAALIAGTGAIAYAEKGGSAFRVGGYGYLFGDEGSAFAIGSAAMKVCLRAFDGRARPDELSEAIARELGASSGSELLGFAYAPIDAAGRVASLAPVAMELAHAGVRSAQRIVQTAALELGELAKTVISQAKLPSDAPLVFAGGLLECNSLLTFLLETRLQNDLPATPIVRSTQEPYVGAVAAAQKLLQ